MQVIVEKMGNFPPGNWDLQEFDDPSDWITELKVLPMTSEMKLLFVSLHKLTADISTLSIITNDAADEQYLEPDDDGDDKEEDDDKSEEEAPKATQPAPQRTKRSIGPFKIQDATGMVFNEVKVGDLIFSLSGATKVFVVVRFMRRTWPRLRSSPTRSSWCDLFRLSSPKERMQDVDW